MGDSGDFGHQLGAMVPGALLAMAFAYVSGQERMFRFMPLLAFVGALGMSLGGTMSYGTLHGYAQSGSFINYTYGYLTLFLVGGVWGGPCGAGLGLVLEDEPLRRRDWLWMVVTVLVYGVSTQAVVVNLLGFHINPPRSDIAIGFFGGMAGLFVWLYRHRKWYGLKGALYGFVGFGIAMAASRLVANASRDLPVVFDNWKIMEIGCGIFGGFVVTYALIGKRVRHEEPPPWAAGVGYVGLFFTMMGIPLLHWIQRMPREDTESKVLGMQALLGIEDPQALIDRLQHIVGLVQMMALVGALVWLAIHLSNDKRFMALPILWFGFMMTAMSNLRSVFPLMGPGEASFRVQSTFWVLYLLLVVFVIYWSIRGRKALIRPEEEAVGRFIRKGVVLGVVAFVVILIGASIIQRENKGGWNTRFPIASYNQ